MRGLTLEDVQLGGLEGRGSSRPHETTHLQQVDRGRRELSTHVMRDLLVLLSEEYDHVVIDSAPLLVRADTSVLVPHVDGVVLVTRSGVTPRAAVQRARERILGMQGRILGVVINNPKRDLGRVDPYGYGYGLGYGYGHETGKSRSKEMETVIAEAAGSAQRLLSSNLVSKLARG